MEIADVIAHAMHFRLLLFLPQQQVEELEAILVDVHEDLAVQEVQEALDVLEVVQEVHMATDQEEHQGHRPRGTSESSKKVNLGGDGELVSSPPSLSVVISWGLPSRVFLPKHNHCPLTPSQCGAGKVELGYRTNPHANWA